MSLSVLTDDGFALWFKGFVEGEACFTIEIMFDRKRQKYQVRLAFSVALTEKDEQVPMLLRNRLGFGHLQRIAAPVYEKWNRNASGTVAFRTAARCDCRELRKLLCRTEWIGKKIKDFETWCVVMDMLDAGEQFTVDGFMKIVRLRETMNTQKTQRKRYTLAWFEKRPLTIEMLYPKRRV